MVAAETPKAFSKRMAISGVSAAEEGAGCARLEFRNISMAGYRQGVREQRVSSVKARTLVPLHGHIH